MLQEEQKDKAPDKNENQDKHKSAVMCAMMKIKPPIKCCMEMLRADDLALFLILGAKHSVLYYYVCWLYFFHRCALSG